MIWPLAFFIQLIAFVIYETKMTPKVAKRLRHAIRKKIPTLTVAFDDGTVNIYYIKEILAEGIIKAQAGGKKLLTFFLPRQYAGKTGENVQPLKELVTRSFTLEGVSHFVAYAGKAVLSNIPTLATLEHAPNTSGQHQIMKGQPIQVIWPVDIRSLKSALPQMYNQSLMEALGTYSELAGLIEAKKYFGGRLKAIMPFMLLALLIIAIIILAGILL